MEGRGLGGKEMPSWSSANLLDLVAANLNFPSSPRHLACLPRVMVDPCILSTAGVANGDSPSAMSIGSSYPTMSPSMRPLTPPPPPAGPRTTPTPSSSNFTSASLLAPRFSTSAPFVASLTASTPPTMTLSPSTSALSSAASPSSFPPTSTLASTIAFVSTTSGPLSTTSSPSIPHPLAAYVLMETLGNATSIKPQSPPPDYSSPLLFSLPQT